MCKTFKIGIIIIIGMIICQFGYSDQISLPREARTQITGKLWNTVGNAYPIEGGYVFALSVDRQEVLGYARTGDTKEYGYGRFDIYDLPGSGEVVLVGFHPKSSWNMAIRRILLTGRYQDIKTLDTRSNIPEDSPGISSGASPLALLAIAGWIADTKNALDQQKEVMSLAERLSAYVERNPLQMENVAPDKGIRDTAVTVDYDGPKYSVKGAGGSILWRGRVSITSSPFWPDNDYVIEKAGVGDVDGDSEEDVVIVARHRRYYPALVYAIKANGKEIGRYWNPGWIYSMVLHDINGDGVFEIVCGATNNDAGKGNNFNIPAVFALDARRMSGEAPPRKGSIGKGNEIWYTFPNPEQSAGIREIKVLGDVLIASTEKGDGGSNYHIILSNGAIK